MNPVALNKCIMFQVHFKLQDCVNKGQNFHFRWHKNSYTDKHLRQCHTLDANFYRHVKDIWDHWGQLRTRKRGKSLDAVCISTESHHYHAGCQPYVFYECAMPVWILFKRSRLLVEEPAYYWMNSIQNKLIIENFDSLYYRTDEYKTGSLKTAKVLLKSIGRFSTPLFKRGWYRPTQNRKRLFLTGQHVVILLKIFREVQKFGHSITLQFKRF